MGDLLKLLATILLVGANAFFVAAEFSLISARRDRLEALAEQGRSSAVTALRAAAAEADATLVVTPEYNGSIPAVIKNAIDWLSRPFGDSALKGKPLAVIGGAYGQYGGVWAHDETRKSFGIAGPRVVESIKLSVPFGTLNGQHPREHAEVAANVRDAVGKLVAEVS